MSKAIKVPVVKVEEAEEIDFARLYAAFDYLFDLLFESENEQKD